MKRTGIVALVCLLASVCAFAYVLLGGAWSSFPVSFRINPSNGPAGNEAAIRAGFQGWQDVLGVSISFNYDGTSSLTGFSQDGINNCSWEDMGSGGPIGLTQTVIVSGTIVESDIKFNNNASLSWSTSGDIDIQTVALHEAGHFLGLGHSADINAIMYPYYQAARRTPASDDLAAVRFLYPGEEILIQQNAPNPFKPASSSDSTTIFFDLGQATHITMHIYNIAGELIKTLLDEDRAEGSHTVQWFGDNGSPGSRGERVGSGVYILVAKTSSGGKDTRKMIVIK